MDLKKLYYYLLSFVALFILFWGTVDLANTFVGSFYRAPAPATDQTMMPDTINDQGLDLYYQKKMLLDRYSDSLIRIIISGLVFLYAKKRANDLEQG
ncbi:MAG: hypothetical protein KKC80_03265 [Candidatus Margulisbacteria bacterium]|nr:hypothetical protein [Candidatus Margulisiibacteriota bacterium]MBU1616685.1 hypothetical protein [Candidatus Margulisiibacteriota bacterium]MBU1867132.1 hypothetical protein [Candidatus Margulisiibacteriota bacterium]